MIKVQQDSTTSFCQDVMMKMTNGKREDRQQMSESGKPKLPRLEVRSFPVNSDQQKLTRGRG